MKKVLQGWSLSMIQHTIALLAGVAGLIMADTNLILFAILMHLMADALDRSERHTWELERELRRWEAEVMRLEREA